MGVLTQMNERPSDIARSLSEFQQSARVLSSDHPRLVDEYPDQWVAVANRKVMAHGDILEHVLAEVDARDISRDDVIIRFIERTPRTLVL